MKEWMSRTALLFGENACGKLNSLRVAVFGVGGVGGFCVEALARAGVGAIDIIDSDCVSESNLNRQIIALKSTVGRPKVEVMSERIRDINPDCVVTAHNLFFTPESSQSIDFSVFHYVVDAIDTVSGKVEIIRLAKEANVPVITSMGAGNKLDPTLFKVTDIADTKVCPLARVMRSELKKRGITKVKAVWSEEQAIEPDREVLAKLQADGERRCPGSVSFVPSVVGLIVAGEVIKDLVKG
jgi:tRNA A37 threonylcarbamoyladenosine dehydratase